MTDFQITHKDGNARRGKLNTKNGVINTPAFMPVGTAATVKAIFTKDIGMKANIYHKTLKIPPIHPDVRLYLGLPRTSSYSTLVRLRFRFG